MVIGRGKTEQGAKNDLIVQAYNLKADGIIGALVTSDSKTYVSGNSKRVSSSTSTTYTFQGTAIQVQ